MSIQQEIAHVEHRRQVHKRMHSCRGKCAEGIYLKQLVTTGERVLEEYGSDRPVVVCGTLPDIRTKLLAALEKDGMARLDPMIFALLAYATLDPGEVMLLEAFEAYDAFKAREWMQNVLIDAQVRFDFSMV